MSGPIPPELGRLPGLGVLYLNHNALSGSIPSELGGLPKLHRLRLGGNQLSGCIPDGLQELESDDLAHLGLPDCN